METHVLCLICDGFSNKEIAYLKDWSVHTVHSLRARLHEKIGVRKAAQLAVFAVRNGIY